MFCIIRAVHLLSLSMLGLIYHVLPPLFCVLFHFIFNDVLSCSSVMSNSLPPFVAHQAPLSMGFPRQEYWNGLLFPPPGDLPNPGIEPSFLMRCRWILYLLSHRRKSDSEPISVQMSSLQVARSGTTLKFQSVLLSSSFALH